MLPSRHITAAGVYNWTVRQLFCSSIWTIAYAILVCQKLIGTRCSFVVSPDFRLRSAIICFSLLNTGLLIDLLQHLHIHDHVHAGMTVLCQLRIYEPPTHSLISSPCRYCCQLMPCTKSGRFTLPLTTVWLRSRCTVCTLTDSWSKNSPLTVNHSVEHTTTVSWTRLFWQQVY